MTPGLGAAIARVPGERALPGGKDKAQLKLMKDLLRLCGAC